MWRCAESILSIYSLILINKLILILVSVPRYCSEHATSLIAKIVFYQNISKTGITIDGWKCDL